MPGCSRAASTRASRISRFRRSPSVPGTSRTFSATRRPRFSSSAVYTTPISPRRRAIFSGPGRKESSFCNPAKGGARFALKFFLTAREYAQPLQRDSSKFTPRPCQCVGHLHDGKSIFSCHLPVGTGLISFQVVRFEQMKSALALARGTECAQVLHRQREKTSHPLFSRWR